MRHKDANTDLARLRFLERTTSAELDQCQVQKSPGETETPFGTHYGRLFLPRDPNSCP
jgi:hypothetical protein